MALYDIITIFPDMFSRVFEYGIINKARNRGILRICAHDLRHFTTDKHRTVDDYPYGGGGGMVLKPEPIYEAVRAIKERSGGETSGGEVIYLTPQGEVFNQKIALELSRLEHLVFICGRYEGIDERCRELVVDREISIGDYVISGGEVAAMVVIDAVVRLIPGVVGNELSVQHESFVNPWLDYPVYTRPRSFKGYIVPEVLLSGNHKAIWEWRKAKAYERTVKRRPDLFET